MKEVFVFGAGASYAVADAPLGNELVWSYYDDCPNCRKEYSLFLEIVETTWPKKFKGISKRFRDKKYRYCYSSYQLLISKNKKYYIDALLKILKDKNKIEGIRLIKKLIFKHIVGRARKTNTAYRYFSTYILKPKKIKDVSIISINFDSLLHEDDIAGIYFDYSIEDFDICKDRVKSYKKQDPIIPLIKLNGSLDWGICQSQKCNKLYLYNRYITHYNNVNFYDNMNCLKCGKKMEPFIVIPHQKQRDERIEILFNRAEEKLKQADKITIIGYSFPKYDKKIRDLFKKAVNVDAKLEVVDYCGHPCGPNSDKNCKLNSIKRTYRDIFPKLENEPEISLEGFQKYIERGKIYGPIEQ